VFPFAIVVAFVFVLDALVLLELGIVVLVFPLTVVFVWENAVVAMDAKNIALITVKDNAIPILNLVFLLFINYRLFSILYYCFYR
jgi:hypothetical protein